MKHLTLANLTTRTCNTPVNITFRMGESWAIVGPNGVGKSTLLHTLAGLLQPLSGQVSWNSQPLSTTPPRLRTQWFSVLLQTYSHAHAFTVHELLQLAPNLCQQKLQHLIGHFEIEPLLPHKLLHLSEGEKQRIMLAVSLARDTPVYLLDEPSNHLDPFFQKRLIEITHSLQQTGKLVVQVLHNINMAQHCDNTILFASATEVLHGPTQQVLRSSYLDQAFRGAVKAVPLTDGQVVWL